MTEIIIAVLVAVIVCVLMILEEGQKFKGVDEDSIPQKVKEHLKSAEARKMVDYKGIRHIILFLDILRKSLKSEPGTA